MLMITEPVKMVTLNAIRHPLACNTMYQFVTQHCPQNSDGPFFYPCLPSGCSVFVALVAAGMCACVYTVHNCVLMFFLCNSFFKEAICNIGNITANICMSLMSLSVSL